MNRRWVCNDVWMDIFPSFDHAQLGLKMALLSPRFNALVDKHFDAKTEFTIWKAIEIRKDTDEMPKLFVEGKSEGFPLPDRPLPNKIIFSSYKQLQIQYIDHFVIEFLRSNQQIWDKGTALNITVCGEKGENEDNEPIWDDVVREIWPFFATNIRQLCFTNAELLDYLRRLISPTILSDLDQLNSIQSVHLFPDVLADDDFGGPNATSAGQALAKWLHNPRKDGQPKSLSCWELMAAASTNFEWLTNFKEVFVRARTSVSYSVCLTFFVTTMPIEPFELVNERTKEKLTLKEDLDIGSFHSWLLKRCPNIVGETAETVQKQQQQQKKKDGNSANKLNNVYFQKQQQQQKKKDGNSANKLNNVHFNFSVCKSIGPLSPPAEAAKEASQSSEKGV